MPANRRIDAAMIAFVLHQPLKQPLPHAVQPLELEIARLPCPFEDGRYGQRIMRGKGGTDIGSAQHVLRAGEIGNIGRRLTGEQRIIGKPTFLRPFDLAVPIGTLDQTNLHDASGIAAQSIRPCEHRAGTL